MRNITARAPRQYELMTILHPEVSEEDLPGALERVAGYVTNAGGTIEETLRESPWGRRRLAYPIRHGGRDLRDGFYTVYHLHLPPHLVDEVERELKLDERIIRYLWTSYEPAPIDPRVLMQQEIDAEDAAAAAYAAAQSAAALAAAQAESGQAQTDAAVAEADSDATDAPATVAAAESVDAPVDAESARVADEAEAIAESAAPAEAVATAAEAEAVVDPTLADDAAADDTATAAEADEVAAGDAATEADAAAEAVPDDAERQG